MPTEGPYIRNVTSLRELTANFYGTLIENVPIESDYSLTTSAAAIGAGRGQRIAVALSNTGANSCAFGFSNGVTITTGILLQAGGFAYLNWYFDYDLLLNQLYAIAAAGNTTLHMVESVLSGS
jgi:hypothetical protein